MVRCFPCERRGFVRHRLRTRGGWRLHRAIDEARSMLAEICSWFTEGFDTADLKAARTLLDELALSCGLRLAASSRLNSTQNDQSSCASRQHPARFCTARNIPSNGPSRKSYSPHPNWFAPSRRAPKNPMNCSICNVAWLWQLPPHREDAYIHACQIRFHPSHHSTR